ETQNKLNYHVDELQQAVKTKLRAIEMGAKHFKKSLSDEQNVNQARLLAESAGIFNVVIAYDDGRSYMSLPQGNGVTTGQQDFVSRDWYSLAKSGNQVRLTEIYTDKVTGEKVISAVMPLYDKGVFQGVLLGDIPLADIITMVSNMRFAGGAATLT